MSRFRQTHDHRFPNRSIFAAFAVTLLASTAYGVSTAHAADLGGNCCADLEERVAELEATAARKGTRNVSLEVSGQVHEAIAFWDDGNETNAYVGSSNNSRSRFRFKGKANIDAEWSAGFLLEFGVRANDLSDTSQTSPLDDQDIDIRHEVLWLKSKTYGTVWFGWSKTAAEGITEIDLGGVFIAEPDVDDWFGNFNLNLGPGLSAVDYEELSRQNTNPGEGDRRNVIRYSSPSIAGFIFDASWGGDDYWDVALRYANEFGAFRFAGGVAYQNSTDQAEDADCTGECEGVGLSASLMHTPTGLFVTGSYGFIEDDGIAAGREDKDEYWSVKGGIKQKFIPVGKTTIYGEYYDYEGGADPDGGGEFGSAADAALGLTGSVEQSEVEVFGVGVIQKIDAAAMEVYVGYRHVEAEVSDIDTRVEAEDFDMVQAGARIKF